MRARFKQAALFALAIIAAAVYPAVVHAACHPLQQVIACDCCQPQDHPQDSCASQCALQSQPAVPAALSGAALSGDASFAKLGDNDAPLQQPINAKFSQRVVIAHSETAFNPPRLYLLLHNFRL